MTASPDVTSTDAAGDPLYAALSATWRAIQQRHPDVPPVMLTLGSGTLGSRGAMRLGHFAENRWQRGEAELHELFIGGEGLREGPAGVLGTLLHEAAHGLATVRGIADTSRRGHYHNKRYKALAEELGLEVAEAGTRGWQDTSVPPATQGDYTDELGQLAEVLPIYRHAEAQPTGGGRSRNRIPAVCACPNPVRAWAARGTLAEQRLTCRDCGQPLRPEDPEIAAELADRGTASEKAEPAPGPEVSEIERAYDTASDATPSKVAELPELGPGWRLVQYPDNERWWLHHHDQIRGYIDRYVNMSGNKSGWQAVRTSKSGAIRVDATAAASHRPDSSYLWRSLALAAWGIATHPSYDAPNPEWARNWRPPRTSQ